MQADIETAIADRRAALERASRALGIGNCLVRATAFRLALTRAGIGSTLHIGVRKPSAGVLAAHAWVSIAGQIIIGGDQMDHAYIEILSETPASCTAAGITTRAT